MKRAHPIRQVSITKDDLLTCLMARVLAVLGGRQKDGDDGPGSGRDTSASIVMKLQHFVRRLL